MSGLAQLERDGKSRETGGKSRIQRHLTVFRGSRRRESEKAEKYLVRDQKAAGSNPAISTPGRPIE